MAACAGSSSSASDQELGVMLFQINTYKVYYKTKNHILDCGIKMMETMADYGQDDVLVNTFCTLLPRDNPNDTFLIIRKLNAVNPAGKFYVNGFEEAMANLPMKYIKLFFIHYPAAPNCHAVDRNNVSLHTECWVVVCQLRKLDRVNAVGVLPRSAKHLIELTEVAATGVRIYRMLWYANYDIKYRTFLKNNLILKEDNLIFLLSMKYNITTEQVLLLWTIQCGGTIIPKLTNNSHFVMESLEINLHKRLDMDDIDLLEKRIAEINYHEPI